MTLPAVLQIQNQPQESIPMPRPRNEVPQETTSLFNPARLAQGGQAAQDLKVLSEAFSDAEREATFLIGQRIGRKAIFESLKKILNSSDFLDLKRIKESKEYKGLRVIDADGKPLTVRTWEDYCLFVEGRSVDSIDLDLKNLETLGTDFFDATRQLGIGPATMRSLRRLPDDQRDVLLEVANTGDKDVFLQTIDDLSAKHAKEKEATAKAHAAALAKAEADLLAKQRVLDASSATIANLHHQLGGEFEPRPGSVAKTEQEEAALEDINESTLECGLAMRRMFLAADKTLNSTASEAVQLLARQAVEYLCQQLVDIATEFNIAVDFEERLKPTWATDEMVAVMEARILEAEAKTKDKTKPKSAALQSVAN